MNTYADVHALVDRMQAVLERMDATGDARRHFHATYLRTTRAVAVALEEGFFLDGPWVERWDVAFAELYLGPLARWDAGGPVPGPWQIAFTAARDGQLPPVRLVLLGMNAHINLDLPQALLATITDGELDDPAVRSRRAEDHRRIDEILVRRVRDEDLELRRVERPGDRTALDRVLTPLNRLSTRRFLKEARRKVWHNALLLSQARRSGRLEERLGELEELVRQRVADLVRPGQVVLRLARDGFGVELPATGPVG